MAQVAGQWDRLIQRFSSSRERTSGVGESVQEHSDAATRSWLYSSIFWLTIVDLFGLILALERLGLNIFGSVPWLVLQPHPSVHVNGVIFAWLSMMC
ncbi:MAG: hypothetical protein R3A10_06440 [Caldilineaceae bacterium]